MKIALLVLGLVVGGAVGWFTAPQPHTELRIGDVSAQVDRGDGGASITAGDRDRSVEIEIGRQSILADRNARTAIFAGGGGIIGLVIGFLVGGRSRTV